MNPNVEPILTALLAHVALQVAVAFTGDTSVGSADISNVSNFTGIFVGIGVAGPGIPADTAVDSFDANAGTITLSKQATADETTAAFHAGFLTVGRRLKEWAKTPNQPALFLRHIGDDDTFNGILSQTELDAEWWIYCRTGDPDAIPDTGLNNLVRAVRLAMVPDDSMQYRFTIGGLCHWCRIEGRSTYDDGALNGQSKALLPVKITLP